jgi:hypothetical protein
MAKSMMYRSHWKAGGAVAGICNQITILILHKFLLGWQRKVNTTNAGTWLNSSAGGSHAMRLAEPRSALEYKTRSRFPALH